MNSLIFIGILQGSLDSSRHWNYAFIIFGVNALQSPTFSINTFPCHEEEDPHLSDAKLFSLARRCNDGVASSQYGYRGFSFDRHVDDQLGTREALFTTWFVLYSDSEGSLRSYHPIVTGVLGKNVATITCKSNLKSIVIVMPLSKMFYSY